MVKDNRYPLRGWMHDKPSVLEQVLGICTLIICALCILTVPLLVLWLN